MKRLTQSYLADQLGLSQPRISELAAMGMPTTSVEDARAWHAANIRHRTAPESGVEGQRKRLEIRLAAAAERAARKQARQAAAKTAEEIRIATKARNAAYYATEQGKARKRAALNKWRVTPHGKATHAANAKRYIACLSDSYMRKLLRRKGHSDQAIRQAMDVERELLRLQRLVREMKKGATRSPRP